MKDKEVFSLSSLKVPTECRCAIRRERNGEIEGIGFFARAMLEMCIAAVQEHQSTPQTLLKMNASYTITIDLP